MTLDEVAAHTEISPHYLSEIERGLEEPLSEIIATAVAALNTNLLDLTLDVARTLNTVHPPAVPAITSRASFSLAG